MVHHLDFLDQAEDYRREFIKTLNDEYAFGGSKTGQRGWKADTAFFQSVADFHYRSPRILGLTAHYRLDIIFLLIWALLSGVLLGFSSKRATVQ